MKTGIYFNYHHRWKQVNKYCWCSRRGEISLFKISFKWQRTWSYFCGRHTFPVKNKFDWNSLVAQRVKDLALSLLGLGSLLWCRFNPWPGNSRMLWVRPKKKKKRVSLIKPSILVKLERPPHCTEYIKKVNLLSLYLFLFFSGLLW